MKLILNSIKSLFNKAIKDITDKFEIFSTETNSKVEEAIAAVDSKLEKENPNIEGNLTMGSCKASSIDSVSLGSSCNTGGACSVAMGYNCKTANNYSVAIGNNNVSSGYSSLAMGQGSVAQGGNSIALGYYTDSQTQYGTTIGKYNEPKIDKALIVGNGTSEITRSNAHTLDWEGNAWFAGSVEGTAIILTSPSGTRYNITVSDTGTLTASAI